MTASTIARQPTNKAYDVLAAQPLATNGLSVADRSEIVISAIADDQGHAHVLSRFGDSTWDMRPFFEQSNVSESFKRINWPTDCPPAMIDDCKAVLYAWFKHGLPGSKPPVARGITTATTASAFPFMRWLKDLGIDRFDQVKPIHISNFVHQSKVELKRQPLTTYNRLRIIEFLWVFRQETSYPLTQYPWGEHSLWRVSGLGNSKGRQAAGRGTGKTPIIPPEVQSTVFNYCESVLAEAHEVLDARDAGKLSLRNSRLIRIRDAALYILSITSGMRNDEAIGVEAGATRRETKEGVEYHWVSTIEHKTGKGKVDYLVPSLTLNVLELMRRYAQPYQDLLETEIGELAAGAPGEDMKSHLLRLDKARRDAKKLFLCFTGNTSKSHIEALSGMGAADGFTRIAKAAGTDWNLLPHQCRRTYARCIVESRMGRASLVFLKWQFKHSSMSMTQLYASNPMQDASIFDEILQEMADFKIDLIESWLGDQPLGGGAGRKITRLRAIPIADRNALLAQTAAQVHIRATGHGWCLAQEKGCGGAGIYEITRCAECKNSVVDESFASVWQDLYEQQAELLHVNDAGPAVRQRAERELHLAMTVMNDLGVSPRAPDDKNLVESH